MNTDIKAGQYSIIREGEDVILNINYEGSSRVPSIEDYSLCMAQTVDKLIESPDVTKIVFTQSRDYEYDFSQTQLLKDIALLNKHFVKDNVINYRYFQGILIPGKADKLFTEVQNVVYNLMKADPLGAYVELRRVLRREKIDLDATFSPQHQEQLKRIIQLLQYLIQSFEKTKLITIAEPYLPGFVIGDREVYRKIFSPTIKPDFMYTKLMANYPVDGEEVDSYQIKNTEITIFRFEEKIQTLYHILPPEFKLSEEKYELLDIARKILSEHKPKKSEFVNPERMRQIFTNVGIDLLSEIARHKGVQLREKELTELAEILVRYTVGFGLVEVLLQDEGIQDISINSPLGQIPIFIVHQDYDDCVTNIIPTPTEAESWASKLRMISGRPLDEANPLLDTELELPGASTRVSTITRPLDPNGIAFSFRRHRDKPWTLPLFIKYKTMTPLAAALISFLVDGTRTMLICGTRSSGKSSLLSAVLVEIMRRYRIITVEDTLELPTSQLRRLGYNIQPMKVSSALSMNKSEMSAEDGIRATLRLGDSALIVGEVRSTEAKALYEAMRVGAAANVVAGTIHGDSPYGIFDRVVNDIGVPKTSFKATDICIIVNPIRSADGLHKFRRVTQITEVRKTWNDDPAMENGFLDLMKYNANTDTIEPTSELINGESDILKMIAGNVKDFSGNWDAVWNNILLRERMKKAQVELALKTGKDELLEADFTIKCNDAFHRLTERIKDETGFIDTERIYFEWNSWLKGTVKRLAFK